MITVLHAPAYCTVQDGGWQNLRRSGMPVSGAMDRWAMHAANRIVGNADDEAVFEWALTAGRLQFDRDLQIAICGPGLQVRHAVRAGEELVLPRPMDGRFLYMSVAGGLDTPLILGSRSTYVAAGLGHAVKTGDRIRVGPLPRTPARKPDGEPAYASGAVRVVEGPQRALFSDAEWIQFLNAPWKVSRVSDRMGYRLEGDVPVSTPAADLPSEAACVGAIQVPPDGMPIVLMADGPTVGGYPKIAVVITADLPILAQKQPGQEARFAESSVAEAQALLRSVG